MLRLLGGEEDLAYSFTRTFGSDRFLFISSSLTIFHLIVRILILVRSPGSPYPRQEKLSS